MKKNTTKKQAETPGIEKELEELKYPANEDIYNKEEKVPLAQKDDPAIGSNDLDIPGSELDDKDEIIGEEDEENNYYSIGGDNHNDLEEDKGD